MDERGSLNQPQPSSIKKNGSSLFLQGILYALIGHGATLLIYLILGILFISDLQSGEHWIIKFLQPVFSYMLWVDTGLVVIMTVVGRYCIVKQQHSAYWLGGLFVLLFPLVFFLLMCGLCISTTLIR